MRDFLWGCSIAVGVGAFIASFIFVIMVPVAALNRDACNKFGATSGREVRFVRYNHFSWDCLTPGSDGKLIPIDNLREEVQPS